MRLRAAGKPRQCAFERDALGSPAGLPGKLRWRLGFAKRRKRVTLTRRVAYNNKWYFELKLGKTSPFSQPSFRAYHCVAPADVEPFLIRVRQQYLH